jgi:hypothetical protein
MEDLPAYGTFASPGGEGFGHPEGDAERYFTDMIFRAAMPDSIALSTIRSVSAERDVRLVGDARNS